MDKCEHWINSVKEESPKNVIICLVGNKIDLQDRREVSVEDMVLFAEKHALNMCFETSAKSGYGMEDMVYEIAAEINACRDSF